MNKINIAVIFGGYSSEHEISKESAETIISNIPDTKYNIIPIYITQEGKWLLYDGIINNMKNINFEKYGTPVIISTDKGEKNIVRIVGDKIKSIKVDVVFPVLHGKNGEDGTIQGILEIAGLPYVGCGVLASAIAMDKAIAKIIVSSLGISTANSLTFKIHQLSELNNVAKKIKQTIGYPCFVKPSCSGSSVGVSKVKNKKELEEAINTALNYDNKILVEKYVKGRELECAVLGTGGDDTAASLVGEVVTNEEFYDFDAKYNNSESRNLVPAEISDDISKQIQEYSLKIFNALNCCGLARVDFFLEDDTNNIVFNEINTLPGFTSISMFPTLCATMGYNLDKLIERLIQIALDETSY